MWKLCHLGTTTFPIFEVLVSSLRLLSELVFPNEVFSGTRYMNQQGSVSYSTTAIQKMTRPLCVHRSGVVRCTKSTFRTHTRTHRGHFDLETSPQTVGLMARDRSEYEACLTHRRDGQRVEFCASKDPVSGELEPV